MATKSARKPSKRTLKKWYDMTQANDHAEVRLSIAKYFGHSIDPDPESEYGVRIVKALEWINHRHEEVGYLEDGLCHCREIIAEYMLKRIGQVYGEEVRQNVYNCL